MTTMFDALKKVCINSELENYLRNALKDQLERELSRDEIFHLKNLVSEIDFQYKFYLLKADFPFRNPK